MKDENRGFVLRGEEMQKDTPDRLCPIDIANTKKGFGKGKCTECGKKNVRIHMRGAGKAFCKECTVFEIRKHITMQFVISEADEARKEREVQMDPAFG